MILDQRSCSISVRAIIVDDGKVRGDKLALLGESLLSVLVGGFHLLSQIPFSPPFF